MRKLAASRDIYSHPLVNLLQSESIEKVMTQGETDPEPEFFEDESAKVGEGLIQWSQRDWYENKFLTLSPWSVEDVGRLLAHLGGENPAMSSFEVYRVAWESVRSPELDIAGTLSRHPELVQIWTAQRAMDAIQIRSKNMGPEVTEAIQRFGRDGYLSLVDFEKECRANFYTHVANRVSAVRTLLVQSGTAIEGCLEDGSIFLTASLPGEELRVETFSAPRLELKAFNLSNAHVSGFDRSPSTETVYKKAVSLDHFSLRTSVGTWEVQGMGSRVTGLYKAPSRARAFGVTSICDGQNSYSIAGTASSLFLAVGTDLRFLVTSRFMTLFGKGKVIFSVGTKSIMHGSYLVAEGGAVLDPVKNSVRLVLGDGTILKVSRSSITREVIQLNDDLCRRLIEESSYQGPEDNAIALDLNRQRWFDVLAATPIKRRGPGFFQTAPTHSNRLSVRDAISMTPNEIEELVSGPAQARELQLDVLKQVSDALNPQFRHGVHATWAQAKVVSELNLAKTRGWKVPQHLYPERPNPNIQMSKTRGKKAYTRLTSFGRNEVGANYLELAGGIQLFEDAEEELAQFKVPYLSNKLEVQDLVYLAAMDPDDYRGPPEYVDFDAYVFSPAEANILELYSLVLSGAREKSQSGSLGSTER